MKPKNNREDSSKFKFTMKFVFLKQCYMNNSFLLIYNKIYKNTIVYRILKGLYIHIKMILLFKHK